MPLYIEINPKTRPRSQTIYLMFEIKNNFYKKSKTADQQTPARVRYEKQFSANISLHPDRWSGCTTPNGPWVNGNDELAIRQNNHIRRGVDKIRAIYQRLLDDTGVEPYAITICNEFKFVPPPEIRKTFNQMMEEFLEKEYETTEERRGPRAMHLCFKTFIERSFKLEDQFLDAIDPPFIYRFEIFLKNTHKTNGQKYAPGTIEQYLKFIRIVMDWGFKMGYMKEKVMDKVTFSIMKNGNRDVINAPSIHSAIKWKMPPSDLQKIEITPVVTKSKMNLDHYRRLFLIQTWCGMGWADMFKIKDCKNVIIRDLSDKDVILYYRQKTGIMGMLPLFPELKALLESVNYRIDPGPYSTYRRGISKMLNHYKLDLEGVETQRSTMTKKYAHLGRHLFGSRMLLMGFEMASVAAMMGHSTIKETEKVYAIPDLTKIQANYEQIKAATHLGLKIAI